MNSLILQLSKIYNLSIEEMYEYYPTFKEYIHEFLVLKSIHRATTYLLIFYAITVVLGAIEYNQTKKNLDDTIELSAMKIAILVFIFVSIITLRIMSRAMMYNVPSPVEISHILDILIF